MNKEKRKAYYQTKKIIQLPENPQWRYWKFQMPDGSWKYLKGIRDMKEMRDLLIKYNPQAFYYSTSLFLNTERVETANFQTAEQLFMDNPYFVVDIDNVYGHQQVKQSSMKVLEIMKDFKHLYKFDGVVFTGRGLRLEFKDISERPNILPQKKEEWFKETRKEFCQKNLSKVSGVDDIIAWDTRRVIKCIGSPNPHNDYVALKITSPLHIPAIPGKVDDATGGTESSPSLQERERPSDQGLGYSPNFPIYFGKFIRSKVRGTKDRFVPFFSYYKKSKFWKKDLEHLQKKYGLSTIYVMDDHRKVYALSVDAIPAPRLDKMYRESKSLLKNAWAKFQNLHIRTSCFFNEDLKKIEEFELKPLLRIDSTEKKMHPLSKPHIDFLNHIGFNTTELPERIHIGKDKNKVYSTFFEKRRFQE